MLNGLSVIVPTINRELVLADTVRDLLAQDFCEFEIIVVDQSPTANQVLVDLAASSDSRLKYIRVDFKGLPQARNFGARQAAHELIVYVDDDIRASPSFLGLHHAAHLRDGVHLVAGGIDEAGCPETSHSTGSFNWWTATPVANFASRQEGPCLHVKGCNFSIRKTALSQVGGFDQALTVGAALYEELELALRLHAAGMSAWFAPQARLTHLAAPMGGCRVNKDWPRYMHGLAHNRGILIFRHLRSWHRPTAILRLLLLGLSYSRLDLSIRPLLATLRGLVAGRRAAALPPVNTELRARECTSS